MVLLRRRLGPMDLIRMLRRPLATVSAMFAILAWVGGCSSTPKDETSAWTPEKLYSEAREEAAAGNYERAAKLFERLDRKSVV